MVGDSGTPLGMPFSALSIVVVAFSIGFAGAWLILGRRRAERHGQLSALHELAERILSAGTDTDVLQLLRSQGGAVFGSCEYRFYRYQRAGKQLERVRTAVEPATERIDLDGGSDEAAARALAQGQMEALPERTLIPLAAAGDPLGLIEIRGVSTKPYVQMLARHLGAVVGAALKVQEQREARDHMRRTEQLAMAGQLLSAIANELREPLEEIRQQAELLLERQPDSLTSQEVRRMAHRATETADTVNRLIGFARTDRTEVSAFEINALLHGLLQLRDPVYRTRGIEVATQFTREPIYVEGVRAQLEEALLQLLLCAEEAGRTVNIQTQSAGGHVLVSIAFGNAEGLGELALCRSLLQAHGGELETTTEGFRLQLPATAAPQMRVATAMKGDRSGTQHLMVLLIEPDEVSRRKLLTALGEEGHRVVPVASAEEGLDLIRRIRFDLAFCAARLPGLKWMDFFEAARPHLGSFVLLTESFDATLRDAGARVLRKPVSAEELQALLNSLATAIPVA